MGHAVYGGILRVPSDKAILDEMGFDGFHRADYTRIVRRKKAKQRHHQDAGVEMFASVILHKGIHIRIETLPANLLVNGITKFLPSGDVYGEPAPFRRFHQSVDSDPCHHLRVDEMPPWTTYLPNTVIGLLPACFQEFEHLQGDFVTRMLGWPQPSFERLKKRVGHLSKDIQLILFVSGIPGS